MADELTKEDIKYSFSLNHIIDNMIKVEGGFKVGEMFLLCSSTIPKGIFAIEGDCSSGVDWDFKS